MNSILIEASAHSPYVSFETNGKLLLEGRSIPEDINKLFGPLIEFAAQIDVEDVVFDINLEYFNTATSKRLLDLMKHFDANNKIKNFTINWHYESDDEDSQEMAEIFEECLTRATFIYMEHPKAVKLANRQSVSS